ncbi:aminotransferase class I/II-fold pyridoxal phosphate-dependent enzyme [Nitrosomonas sp. Is37]|uniref:aminotransferase class I/II-fold pyridoxal phosphate-dependent enzyme n=1 Tax=Nitrosomonas sp. Is37 TaxID=3080535 RepID=UPI00294B6466|nr:aminotransferase class I/II-fold pyridoxal phosphate-dependent enzyme [Nitrosomonas sp. Is37]MDV6343052.1 aminotransferase class I/II-fold pyridoxal phosphate-dependent enzyme [Nitrosomonas sp. Is37]
MSLEQLNVYCTLKLAELKERGAQKGAEKVIAKIALPGWIKEGRLPTSAEDENFGPRYFLAGDERAYLLMNSNSYLGLTLHPKVMAAEEEGVKHFGTGPGAVRFISGTYQPHVELEKRLAAFHGRASAMIYSAAYTTVMGVLPALIDEHTLVVSDQLNHNCIINAIRLSYPAKKEIFKHLDMTELERILSTYASGKNAAGGSEIRRVLVITDGIFSMRGDCAPLDEIVAICRKYEQDFADGIITIADDSHGVGAFGETGRGTEEYTQSKVDILIATLGKALGVNGGYVVASAPVIDYLREISPFYVYSNPITPSEALAAIASLEILESKEGLERLARLRELAVRFENGLTELGFETIPGEHPVTPLVVRDTQQTALLIEYLFQNGILATGLNYPVVPKGDEEIRFQINANHTTGDIDYLLSVLKNFLAYSRSRS